MATPTEAAAVEQVACWGCRVVSDLDLAILHLAIMRCYRQGAGGLRALHPRHPPPDAGLAVSRAASSQVQHVRCDHGHIHRDKTQKPQQRGESGPPHSDQVAVAVVVATKAAVAVAPPTHVQTLHLPCSTLPLLPAGLVSARPRRAGRARARNVRCGHGRGRVVLPASVV